MARDVVSVDSRELRRALAQLPDQVDEVVRDVVRESAQAVRDDTRSHAARNTGAMADGVDIRYATDGQSAEVGWFDPGLDYPEYVEQGTSSQPAQPALGPAAEGERGRLQPRLTERMSARFGG